MTLPTYIQGKYADAEPLYARATEIWEKALGPEHPSLAAALNNRAGLLKSQVRAVRLLLEISRRICSSAVLDPFVLNCDPCTLSTVF